MRAAALPIIILLSMFCMLLTLHAGDLSGGLALLVIWGTIAGYLVARAVWLSLP